MAAPFNFYVCRRIPAIIKTPISLINLETNAAKISKQQITHARLYSSENQFRIPKNTWNFRSIKSSFRIAALVFGGGFVLRNLTKNWNGQKVYADADDNEELNRPDHTPSREVRVDTDNSGLKLTIYQYQTCPFCCKTRAYLDYMGFSYDVIEVNSVSKKEL